MKPLKIYLADLTYDTITISTEAMPLNIGFIASYSLEKFKNDVNITLFKYINKLEKAIRESPPDVLGLSNYIWSHNIASEIFKIFREINPHGITVWGGPNFPLDFPSQKKFMEEHPEVDIYVPTEGEVGFANVVKRALQANSVEEIKQEILKEPIDNCISRDFDGKLQQTFTGYRIKKLDEIPSPYTTGLLDQFFDGDLNPMLQTTRGCPFHCTFCTDGADEVDQVNRFSPNRVQEDINYIAEHVPENTHTLYISDLNFGMLPGDIKTCDELVNVQHKYNFPTKILATTGKNSKERIIESIKRLNGTMALSMSVQSMDQEALTNIRRPNISVKKMMALAPTIREYDLLTTSEVILGLPGESYEKHIDGLRKLVEAEMDYIVVHNSMLLHGSEMNIPEQRKKWNFKTKFRIVPRDFARLSNGKNICEIEEIVVGSSSMTFDEFLNLRLVAFVLWVTNQGIVYDSIIKLLREYNVDVFELFYRMAINSQEAPPTIQNIFENFLKSTKDELWNSPEEIKQFVQKETNFKKLVNGEAGFNVIQYHHASIMTCFMDDWTEYVLKTAYELLEEKENKNEEIEQQFLNVANFCRGISHNPLEKNRMSTNPKFDFHYNVPKWLKDNNLKLLNFKLSKPLPIEFRYSEEQSKIIQDNLDFYGDNLIGKTKALKAIPFQMLWRKPIGYDFTSEPPVIRSVEAKRWNTI